MATEWKVEAPALAKSLERDFNLGQTIDDHGRCYLIEKTVDRIQRLKIEIFADEHPPPHFRASCAGETANFAINYKRLLQAQWRAW